MKIGDYYLLVLRAFDALEREIKEAEEFTAQQYNNGLEQDRIRQQQALAAQQQAQQAQQAAQQNTEEKKEDEPEDINI